MAEKIRHRLTKVGVDQLKEGVEFKKILIMMRQLFENWEERNKFLAKRFFIRKWFMQLKKLKERDAKFDDALKVLDKSFQFFLAVAILYFSAIHFTALFLLISEFIFLALSFH